MKQPRFNIRETGLTNLMQELLNSSNTQTKKKETAITRQ